MNLKHEKSGLHDQLKCKADSEKLLGEMLELKNVELTSLKEYNTKIERQNAALEVKLRRKKLEKKFMLILLVLFGGYILQLL